MMVSSTFRHNVAHQHVNARKVLDVLRQGPAMRCEIARRANLNPKTVSTALAGVLARHGCVMQNGGGWWAWTGRELGTSRELFSATIKALASADRPESWPTPLEIRQRAMAIRLETLRELNPCDDEYEWKPPRKQRTPAEACKVYLAEWRQMRRGA